MLFKTGAIKLKPKAWGLLGLLAVCVCFSPEVVAQTGYSGSSPAATEVRLQQLEMQLRDLTGKIEEQNYQIRQMQERLDKALGDMDVRLQDAERGGSSGSMSGGFSNGGSAPPSSGEYPPSPGSSDGGNYQWSSNNTGGAPSSSGQLGGSSDASAAAAYENAYALLKGGKYDEAEKGFQAFMEQYPSHVLAGNAQYWLGETYYVRGDYDRASRTFAAAYKNYPKSAKAADNLLKLGMALAAQGSKDDACTALGQIGREFSSAGPVLQRAQQEMTRLGCQ